MDYFTVKTCWLWERCPILHIFWPCDCCLQVSDLIYLRSCLELTISSGNWLIPCLPPHPYGSLAEHFFKVRWWRDWKLKQWFSNMTAYWHPLWASKNMDAWVPRPEILINLSAGWPELQGGFSTSSFGDLNLQPWLRATVLEEWAFLFFCFLRSPKS